MTVRPITVIGGGLAGCEAAWQAARRGVPVTLHEMRPVRSTDAHKTGRLAELVCSNSFRSDDALGNAVGLLHEEMRRLGSLVMAAADRRRLPAGGALAVDREGFAAAVEAALEAEPLVTVRREEVTALPPERAGLAVVATGPLTSPALAAAIRQAGGEADLAFFDAIAPIVHRETVDMGRAWFQSRYDKAGPAAGASGGDYINCGLERDEYDAFVDALLAAETTGYRDFEQGTPFFEGCLPVEVMARRGRDTLRFGPMKPVGLVDPRTGRRPWAVVQLRQDNALGTLFNLVGFQTKMRHAEQVRVLRLIPGLARAEFARLGGLHRNTFINSPRLLDPTLRLEAAPWLRFAGQITGCEGYVESAAIGLLAGRFAAAEALGEAALPPPPAESAHGALLGHVTGGAAAATFQPMNVNYGLFPPLPPIRDKAERRAATARRALAALEAWDPDARGASMEACPSRKVG